MVKKNEQGKLKENNYSLKLRECNPWIWQTTGVPKSSFFYIFLLGKKPKVGEI